MESEMKNRVNKSNNGQVQSQPDRSVAGKWSRAISIPLLSGVAVLLGAALGALVFGAHYALRGLVLDAVLLSVPVGLALWSTRSTLRTALFALLLAGLLLGGEAAAMATLGTPLRISDIAALPTLISVMPTAQKALAGISIAVGGALVLWLLKSPWPRWPGLAAGLAVIVLAFPQGNWGTQLASRLLPSDSLGEEQRLVTLGSIAFLASENAVRPLVDAKTIEAIAGDLQWSPAYSGKRRNIHLVLLESFWDPLKLRGYKFSDDPFDPRFREMIEASAGSMALTPHFGHLTANAEFEALCGLPAPEDGAVFVNELRNPMPCLPRILSALGYYTQASHANSPDSWSRDRAYELVGFNRFNSSRGMQIDDTDELFLTDASFYRQNLEVLGTQGARPLFNYLVSLSSHWPFKRDRKRRPDRISVAPADQQVSDYANAIRYSSEAFADWVEAVRKRDPDALIVAYGDHAPTFPPAQNEYRDSGYPIHDHAALSVEQLLELAGTPLLLIDGRAGVVPVGVVPVSSLPHEILKRAFAGQVELPQVKALRASVGGEVLERRYLGRLLVGSGNGWEVCDEAPNKGENSDCRAGAKLMREGELLREDMTGGQAYFQNLVHIPSSSVWGRGRMEVPTAGCGLEIVNFGPKNIDLGKGFNVQKKSGESAFWFNLKSRAGRPNIRIGNQVLQLTMNGLFASAAVAHPAFTEMPGEHPVYVVCEGKPDTKLGSVFVRAPGNPRHEERVWEEEDMRMPLHVVRRDAGDSDVHLEARLPEQVCSGTPAWRGPVLVRWMTHSSDVRLLVRDGEEKPYQLWSSGGPNGQSITGNWASDGMQIRVEGDGKPLGEFVIDSQACIAKSR